MSISVDNLKNNIDALGEAFHEFKQTHTQKIQEMQQTKRPDPLHEEKLQRIEAHMQKIEKNLSTKKTDSGSIPRLSLKGEEGGQFSAYLRQGDTQWEKKFHPGTEEDGGVLLPQDLQHTLTDQIHEDSVMRQHAKVVEISSRSLSFIRTQRGQNFDVKWLADKDTVEDAASPKLEKIDIALKTMYSNIPLHPHLLSDTQFPVESWIFDHATKKMLDLEESSFIHGDGNTTPYGIFKESFKENEEHPDHITFYKTGAEAGIDKADVLYTLASSLKSAYRKNAVWMMSPNAWAAIRRLKSHEGYHVWQPPLLSEKNPKLLGHDVVIHPHLSALNQEGDSEYGALLGDFSQAYVIVNKPSPFSILRDEYSKKPFIQLFIRRCVGGKLVDNHAVKALKFAK